MEGRNGGEIDLRGETLIGKTKPNKTMETKLNRIAQQMLCCVNDFVDSLLP